MRIRITDSQMTALLAAGVFEPDLDEDDEFAPLREAIDGQHLVLNPDQQDEVAELICQLSNEADALGHGYDVPDPERQKEYRRDSRVLANLWVKALKPLPNKVVNPASKRTLG